MLLKILFEETLIKAVAVDNDGAKTADSVEVTVNSFPECALVYPPDNSYHFTGEEIEIKVSAYDEEVSKSVTKVSFYADGVLVSEDDSFPYNAVWTMTEGSHILSTRVTDDTGTFVSDSITVHTERIIQFDDPVFEQVVRRDFLISHGDIYASYVGGVTEYEGITDITGIEYFRSLEELNLYSNQISDISPLKDLANIRILTLSNNVISDISILQNFNQMTVLNIENNLINDISALRELLDLKELNLASNNISTIDDLKDLKKLNSLNLSNCGVSDFSHLSKLTNISYLNLQDNSIADLTPLSTLLNLKSVNLMKNLIADLKPLAGLKSLIYLNIQDNKVEDISALKHLTELGFLEMSDNLISDIYPLILNDGVNDGDYIFIYSNPLDSISINDYIPILEMRGVRIYW